MEHAAEMLRTADRALSTAYIAKTGMSEAEVLEMMEHETWLTAEQAKERGLVDAVMFEEQEEILPLVAGPMFVLPGDEQMEKVRTMMKEADGNTNDTSASLMQQLNLLKLRGEKR